MNTDEREERQEAPERFWIERRTQHVFIAKPDPYVETVEVGLVADFNRHYEDFMRAALLREQNAATRMRDKCVAELNSLLLEYELEQQERTEDEGHTHRIVRAAILATQRAIARVESLTLESAANSVKNDEGESER